MRRIIALILICVMLLGTAMPVAASNTGSTVHPRFTHIVEASANLQISNWGIASCSGSLTTRTDYPVKIVIRLQQLKNSSWTTVKEWEITDIGGVSDTRYYAVYSGYHYRVFVNAYVYNDNGDFLEYTYVEKQVYYG